MNDNNLTERIERIERNQDRLMQIVQSYFRKLPIKPGLGTIRAIAKIADDLELSTNDDFEELKKRMDADDEQSEKNIADFQVQMAIARAQSSVQLNRNDDTT